MIFNEYPNEFYLKNNLLLEAISHSPSERNNDLKNKEYKLSAVMENILQNSDI